jgi:hypothetical protein
MEIRESVGYVSERMEKMEWEDIGKYRVRGGKCREIWER